jgi:hypothetical protein
MLLGKTVEADWGYYNGTLVDIDIYDSVLTKDNVEVLYNDKIRDYDVDYDIIGAGQKSGNKMFGFLSAFLLAIVLGCFMYRYVRYVVSGRGG